MSWTIEPLHVPETIDAADADGFRAHVAAQNAEWRRGSGGDVHDEDPREVLSRWRSTRYQRAVGVLARDGDRVLGSGGLSYDRSTSRTADVEVALADDVDEAVAGALLDAVDRLARTEGRDVLHTWTIHPRPIAGAPALVPPTGAGSVPADDPAARRLAARGWELSQVERHSVFDLHDPQDATERVLADALAAAGEEYRAVWWTGATPPEHADGYAAAIARMDSDVPAGEMTVEQSTWDAERVRTRDARLASAGQLVGVTIVVHQPTGVVAAFNELTIGPDRTRPTAQHGTLVLPEHRGRRLGAIVKCVGLRRWREAVPESPLVSTFNAEENRHMLAVNEAVGFVPAGSVGAWQRTLG